MTQTEKNIEKRIKLAKIRINQAVTELEKAKELAFEDELNGTGVNLAKDLESIANLKIYVQ